MDTHVHSEAGCAVNQPWNKGKLAGAKPPLSPKHVWAVRTRLFVLKAEPGAPGSPPGPSPRPFAYDTGVICSLAWRLA